MYHNMNLDNILYYQSRKKQKNNKYNIIIPTVVMYLLFRYLIEIFYVILFEYPVFSNIKN